MFINTKTDLALALNPWSFTFSSHVALTLSPLHDVHLRDSQLAQALGGGGGGGAVGCLLLLLHLDECPGHHGAHEREPA